MGRIKAIHTEIERRKILINHNIIAHERT